MAIITEKVKNVTDRVIEVDGIGIWQPGEVRDVPQSYCLPQRKKNGGTSPSVLEMRGYGKALQVLPGGAKVEGKRAVERLMARGHSAGAAALLAEAEEDPGTDVVAGDSVDVFEEVLSDESPTKRAPRRRKRSE